MNIFNKHNSNNRGRLLFSSKPDKKGSHCEIYEYIPLEDELDFYKESTKEPVPFIKKLMKYKSKEEQLMATERILEHTEIAQKIQTRLENEKKNAIN